jgi:PAS domain S-box-containing protein
MDITESQAGTLAPMRELLRRPDWDATPLGPPRSWSPALHAVVGTLLALPAPACLLWGEPLVAIPNDAWTAIAPSAAGGAGEPPWAETCGVAPPFAALLRGEPHDRRNVPFGAAGRHDLAFRPLRIGAEPEAPVMGVLVCALPAADAAAPAALARAEAALLASEARFARAVEAARAGTWDWDPVADVLTGSPGREERLTGRPTGSQHDLATMLEAVHPEDRAAVQRALGRVQDGETDDMLAEFRSLWPDGTVRWLRAVGRATRDAQGALRHLGGGSLDVTEEVEARQRQALLAREVDHRAKNALAVVQSVVRLTPASDPASFRAAVEGRIAALSRAQSLLAAQRWEGAPLLALLEGELAPFLGAAPRVALQGGHVMLPARAVQPMAMALHELVTNAAKHGALSVPEGRVALCWTASPQGNLRLHWVERDGPPVSTTPPRRGFGSRVLDGTVRHQLGGVLALDFAPGGFACTIDLALGDSRQAA